MLESSSLSFGPWSALARHAPLQRDIRDAEAGRHLGLARWLTPPLGGWRGWFRRPVLEIVESDDESLLCTLHRGWRPLPMWDVLDADGRFIGTMRGGVLRDPLGRRFAVLTASAKNSVRQFLDPQGQEMGTLASMAGGPQLTFAASLQENPFAKMILLAAALVE